MDWLSRHLQDDRPVSEQNGNSPLIGMMGLRNCMLMGGGIGAHIAGCEHALKLHVLAINCRM